MKFQAMFKKDTNKCCNICKIARKPTNCLSVFDHFVGLTLKGLKVDKKSNFSLRDVGFKSVITDYLSNMNFHQILLKYTGQMNLYIH